MAKTLLEEINEKQQELDKLKQALEEFPDLQRHVDRWNTVRYISKSVNPQVDNFDSKHSCGCCSDSPLQVWPYARSKSVMRVYSDPPRYSILNRQDYRYIEFCESEFQNMIQNNINPKLITKISDLATSYFAREEDNE